MTLLVCRSHSSKEKSYNYIWTLARQQKKAGAEATTLLVRLSVCQCPHSRGALTPLFYSGLDRCN